MPALTGSERSKSKSASAQAKFGLHAKCMSQELMLSMRSTLCAEIRPRELNPCELFSLCGDNSAP